MKRMFCPSCGSTKGPFFRGLCRKCFLRDNPVSLPEETRVPYCRSCGRVKLSGKWVEQSEESLKAFVAKETKVKWLQSPRLAIGIKPLGEKSMATVRASGLLDGNSIAAEARTMIVPAGEQCNSCMLLASGYFEATLQIRFSHKAGEKEKQAVLEEIGKMLLPMRDEDRLASITRVIDRENGFDVLLASNNAAKRIAKRLSSKSLQQVKRSSTLVGREKTGRERKRFTYCVRF
jgi:NMD protein affecting ribosome stability and mRNA decay